MLNYWAQIFILPKDVIDQVTKLCKNFLWGGEVNYSKIPYVGWDRVCNPKKQGGLGIKNFLVWNKACVAKLVWAIAKIKDPLWIKWVHGRYIQEKGWENYTPKGDTSWYWKKLHKVKALFKDYPKENYKVKEGYQWLL